MSWAPCARNELRARQGATAVVAGRSTRSLGVIAMSVTTIIIGVVVVLSVIGHALGWSLPNEYRRRPCQGRLWRRQFPDAPKEAIREFLSIFVRSFAFRERDRLKFSPDDQVLAIYRALYPSREQPDALEFTFLSRAVADRYGVAISELEGENLTLGQVFRRVRSVGKQ